jgi:urea-proton symporter
VNPTASDSRLKLVSHISLAFFAIFSASFSTGLYYSGVSMGWILEFVGVVLGSAVFPITFAVNSAHASPLWMTISAPIGTACGLVSWLAITKGMYGAVNVTTTFENWPMFTGCTVSMFVPLILWFAMWPLHKTAYDWDKLFLMQALHPRLGDKVYTHEDDKEFGHDFDLPGLARASRNAKIVSAVMVAIFLIIIPFSLYGSGYSFSRNFFTGWTVVVFIWSFVAALLIWCLPIWEARKSLATVFGSIFGRKGRPTVQHTEGKEIPSGAETPAEDQSAGKLNANEKVAEVA